MPCYVYIIRCTSSSGKISYYTGYTTNILRRFKEHRSGKGARYLRGKHDLFVVHFEIHGDVSSAMRREREIKRNGKLKASLVDKDADRRKLKKKRKENTRGMSEWQSS